MRDSYLGWMRRRIQKIHRVLKDTGSIFLHCDHHANYKLRIILDDIFGEKSFRNEILWRRKQGSNTTGVHRNFSNNSDHIFYYSKSEKHKFNIVYINDKDCLPSSVMKHYRHDDNDGKGIVFLYIVWSRLLILPH